MINVISCVIVPVRTGKHRMWLIVAVLLLLATGHQLDITRPIDPVQLMKVYYVDGSTQVLSDKVVLTPDSASKAGRVTSLYVCAKMSGRADITEHQVEELACEGAIHSLHTK